MSEGEWNDDEHADKEAAELVVTSIKPYIGERACIFMESDGAVEAVHGKIMAVLQEWPALVVRDLTPTKERLQRKRLITLDVIRDICFAPSAEKCRTQCEVFRELLAEAKGDEPTKSDEPGEKEGESNDA